jgi:hypothetical protein
VFPNLGTARLLSGNTADEPTLLKALDWIQDCIQNHAQCRQESEDPLPKRVLDLFPEDLGQDIRLLETKNELHQYACLSHCWGDSRSDLRTTKKTIAENLRQISLINLPKTFKDAVSICRRLGIRYLWIDSMCIIQGDKEDWEEEAPKMATIYGNAYVTIAASGAKSDDGGCYSTIPLEFETGCLSITDADGVSRRLYVRNQLPHTLLHSNLPFMDRAWIFQERILSPRVLYFTPSELSWECTTKMDCQCSHFEKAKTFEFAHIGFTKLSYDKMLSGNLMDQQNVWHAFVLQYSCLKMTFEKDRLPAISGVAKQMQQFRKQKYYEGLWEDSIVFDMSWYSGSKNMRSRPNQPHPPSWSWGSTMSSILYFSVDIAKTTLRAKHISLDLDSTGEADSKSITLQCTTIPAVLHFDEDIIATAGKTHRAEFELFTEGKKVPYILLTPDYTFYKEEKSPLDPVYILWLASHNGLEGFLIIRRTTRFQDTYERIAFVIVSKEEGKRILLGCKDISIIHII